MLSAKNSGSRMGTMIGLDPGVLDEFPLGVVLIDTDAHVVYTNPALREITGIDLTALIADGGADLCTLSPFRDSEEFLAGFSPLSRGERINFRCSLAGSEGNGGERETVCRVQGFPLAQSDEYRADALLLFEDITEGYRLETQLGRAQRMESVGSLASAVAHDFNNILTVILSSVHLLKQDFGRESRYRGPLDVIENTALSAGELAEQLLSLARPGGSEHREIDLNAVVSEARPLLQRVLREGISLDIRLEPDIWCLAADPSQILHTLVNLCINAQEAMAGVGTITISTTNIDRSSGTHVEGGLIPGHYVLLSVSDTGHGIPAGIADRVFDPFFTTRDGGTGLGLSTAYSFATEQGGTVTLYSEPGRGTQINVYLRAEPRSPQPVAGIPDCDDDLTLAGTETILLVDDEPLLLELGTEILELHGYTVVAASSGEDAVRTVESRPGRIPLAILDMAMPGMNGIETLRTLRSRDPGLKAIISSGFHTPRKMKDLLGTEVDAFVNKPYEIDALAREVRRLLDLWNAENG